MLYQFIVKVLMGSSDTIFTALVMGLFGYVGWLLWNINERIKEFVKEWNKHEESLNVLKTKMDKIDEGVYRELASKLDQYMKEMDKLMMVVNDNSSGIERLRTDIISEIKESTDEVKDIIMILMNNRARSFNKEDNIINDKNEIIVLDKENGLNKNKLKEDSGKNYQLIDKSVNSLSNNSSSENNSEDKLDDKDMELNTGENNSDDTG